MLFVSYDGLLDPLGQSQILPYILGLIRVGYKFSILSYEKDYRDPIETLNLRNKLKEYDIDWYYLRFNTQGRKGKFLRHLFEGAKEIRRICRNQQYQHVHLRGFVSAFIYKLSFVRQPYIYDYRSFTVDEWAEAGSIKFGSYYHRFLKLVDQWALTGMSALVVLEPGAKELLKVNYFISKVPTAVIRTATDPDKYIKRTHSIVDDGVKFIHLGGVLFPYRIDKALEFVEKFQKVYKNSTLTFFNEGQHKQLWEFVSRSSIDASLVTVETVNHNDIPVRLSSFDAGLIFIEPTPCRKVCSPTKLGEYLAAGLPVISAGGIEVIDYVSNKYNCIRILTTCNEKLMIDEKALHDHYNWLNESDQEEHCVDVSLLEFGMISAINKYAILYDQLHDVS